MVNFTHCQLCGKIFKKRSNNDVYCRECADNVKYYEPIETKKIVCVDCGKEIEIESTSRKIRCDECFKKERSRINANYRKKTSSFKS